MQCGGGVLKEWRRCRAERRSSKAREWTVACSQLTLRLSDVLRANLKGAEKNMDSPTAPFWTTVSRTATSPLFWCVLIWCTELDTASSRSPLRRLTASGMLPENL